MADNLDPTDDVSWDDAQTRKDPEPFLLDIRSGEYDGVLVRIIMACQERFQHGNTAQRWSVTYDGDTFTEDDLTLAEARTVEKETNTNWAFLNPAGSADHCIAVITSCLHHRKGMKLNEAREQVGKMTVREATEAMSSYEVEVAPKGSGT